mgnify:CR=1 FL=1|tara:strand:+ start:1270 stop:1536 length:267 start_codon:yes stop_codon:yes gene_type:complete
MTEERLTRIEKHLDKMSAAMVDMARMEERLVSAFKRMDTIVEFQTKMDSRLDEMEKQAIARGQKIAFAERIFWMICTGAVGLAFVYLR